MSLKYRDKNGAEVVLAGLTPGGDIEYGAVATREGNIQITINASSSTNGVVTFTDPMPDADYEIIAQMEAASTSGNPGSLLIMPVSSSRTVNGFYIAVWNYLSSAQTITVHWKAFKLYEVADAEQFYSKVQDLEAMVPSNASSTNKFTTADDLRTETRTLDRRLDDVEDVIPTSANITNKLVTQNDLSGVEIDKVEDINDVELTNIQDGQTLIWDDANSKWVNGQGGKIYTAGDGINISNTDEISAKVDDTSITTDTNDALKVADTYKTIFVGTRAQWDALSTADQVKYNEAHITDDVIGGEVADEVTDGLMSPVTSNAVFDALHDIGNTVFKETKTVANVSSASQYVNLITKTIPKGKWLIFGHVSISVSISSAINNQLTVTGGGYNIGTTRTAGTSGGGSLNMCYAISDGTAVCTLRTYSVTGTSFNFNGTLIGIKLGEL